MTETYHVIPENDLKPHTHFSDYCKCEPVIEDGDGARMVIHNAYDGREFFE